MIKDLRYAIRSLLKRPGFLLIAVSTLALGIGATTAMFTVVNSVLLRPLQFPEPERIVVLEGINPQKGIKASSISVPDLIDWQKQSQSFEHIAGFFTWSAFLATGDEIERIRAAGVSPEFFPTLRTQPIAGRVINSGDAQANSTPVSVISYGLWQRRYGGAPDVVNREITLSGVKGTIVGIMPPGFDYPNETEVWTEYRLDADEVRDNRYANAIGRLKPGVALTQAQAEMDTINQRLEQNYAEFNTGWSVRLTELRERMVGELRTSLLRLFGAVAFVLLIACANVANLLLARAAYRQREIAVRTALGASRWRIVRQLLTESVLLSVVSGAVGLALSVWLIKLLVAISPPNTARFDEIALNWQVFIFIFGVTILAGLLFGLVPALQSSRTDLNETLKESGRTGAPGATRNRIGGILIVSEVALSFVLLACAGLLIKSFMHLREINPGFEADNVLAIRVSLPAGKYDESAEGRAQFYRQLVDQVKAVPGVQSAGAVLSLPLRGDTLILGRGVLLEGRRPVPEEASNALHLAITPDYFQTMQIPLKQGRAFTDHDDSQAPKVVIVNETMARKLWPGESPVGKRFSIWRDEKFSREVVGVVGDTKMRLDEEAEEQMYVPYAQDPNWWAMSLVVRSNNETSALATSVREAIRSVDKGVATYNLKTMNDLISTSAAPRRVPMLLLSAFAGVAMLLAMLGIYGITSYYVTQRTHEIGVRMALGAQIADVLKLVLRRAMLLAVIGVVLGLAGAAALTRYLTSLLFGVQPIDVFTFGAVALGLVVVALVASLIPAKRATKVDPLVALRYE